MGTYKYLKEFFYNVVKTQVAIRTGRLVVRRDKNTRSVIRSLPKRLGVSVKMDSCRGKSTHLLLYSRITY